MRRGEDSLACTSIRLVCRAALCVAAIDKADGIFEALGLATGQQSSLAADLEEMYGTMLDGRSDSGAFGAALDAMGIARLAAPQVPALAPPPRAVPAPSPRTI